MPSAARELAPGGMLPVAADIGRRLQVFWESEGEWFPGVLAAIEAGHDDDADTGDYHVIYDDGDEQWEPLGSRTPFKWVSGRRASGASSRGNTSTAKGGAKTGPARKAARKPQLAPTQVQPMSVEASATAATALPVAADIGRRLQVHWESEGEWFPGVLAAIEAGHDDGADTGDYHVVYDDGDEQWEPLGSRTPFRWSGDRLPSAPSHGSSSGEALSPPGRAPPRPKRALSERSHLIALPEAKASSCSNSNVEIDLQ